MANDLRTRLSAFRSWTHTHEGRKMVRFVMTSVISTFVSEFVILAVYGLNWTHSPMWASAVGNIVAMLPAYYLHRRWAWGKTGASHWRKEVLPYVALNVLGLLVSLGGAMYCRHIVYTHHLSHLVNTVLVAGVNLVSFAIFWVLKLVLFNRIFHTNRIALYDEHLSDEERTH